MLEPKALIKFVGKPSAVKAPDSSFKNEASPLDWTSFLKIYFEFGYFLCLSPFRLERNLSHKLAEDEKRMAKTGNNPFQLRTWFPQQLLSGLLTLLSIPCTLTLIRDMTPRSTKDPSEYFNLAQGITGAISLLIQTQKLWMAPQVYLSITNHLHDSNIRPSWPSKMRSSITITLLCTTFISWSLMKNLGGDLSLLLTGNYSESWENSRDFACRAYFLERNGQTCSENDWRGQAASVLAIPAKIGIYYTRVMISFVQLNLLLTSTTLWLLVRSFLKSVPGLANGELLKGMIWLKELSMLMSHSIGHQSSCMIFQAILGDSLNVDDLLEMVTGADGREIGFFEALHNFLIVGKDLVILLIMADICHRVSGISFLP